MKTKVKSYIRKGGIRVNSFYKKIKKRKPVKASSPTQKKPFLEISNKQKIASASLILGGAAALASAKVIHTKNREKATNLAIKRSEELETNFRSWLSDPTKRQEVEDKGKAIWKENSRDPFERIKDPEVFQEYKYLKGLEEAIASEDKKFVSFVAGGFDTTGKTSQFITGEKGKPGLPTKLSGLNSRGKLGEESILDEDTLIPFLNHRVQASIGFPHQTIGIGSRRIMPKERLGVVGDVYVNAEKIVSDFSVLGKHQAGKGYNSDGVEMAAAAMAMSRITGKPIHLIGQCGGGLATMEAASIIDRFNKKNPETPFDYKVLNIATPNLTFYDLDKSKVKTVYSKKDAFADSLPSFNGEVIDDVNGHSYFKNGEETGYENSPQLKRIMRRFFYGKD